MEVSIESLLVVEVLSMVDLLEAPWTGIGLVSCHEMETITQCKEAQAED